MLGLLGGGVVASPLLTNLAAYWKLDEAAGVNRADSVGSSTAVLNGTVASVAGKVGNGASFNGNAANYLSVTDNPVINPAGISFTVAFWYKLNVSTNQGFISKFAGSGGNEFIVDFATTPIVRFLFYGATTSNVTVTPGAVDTTTFYAVRAWYDLPTNKIWLQWHNGTPASADAPVGGINISDSDLRFGVFDQATRPGNCVLDEIGFWWRILTSDEWTAYLAAITYPFS
jgi:hypothetical protein